MLLVLTLQGGKNNTMTKIFIETIKSVVTETFPEWDNSLSGLYLGIYSPLLTPPHFWCLASMIIFHLNTTNISTRMRWYYKLPKNLFLHSKYNKKKLVIINDTWLIFLWQSSSSTFFTATLTN